MLIGICGKSGSGKSTLAITLEKELMGRAIHCDIDKISHKCLEVDYIKDQLIKTFGKEIGKNNIIDRKALGKIVFNSKKEMDKLTEITWEYMQKEIDELINENKNKIIILDWLLLPKSKYFDKCSLKILLDIPYQTRKKRAMSRDNITEEAFDLRESATYNYNKNNFDYILQDNNKEEIERLVKLI